MLFAAPDEKFGAKNSKFELLSRAFSIPVNDALMIQHLRQVDFSSTKKMLSTLFDVLEAANGEGDTFERTLLWIGMVLNAHYTNFVMSRDDETREQLTSALAVVDQVSVLSNFFSLSVMMGQN